MSTIRDTFFENKAAGALWDVAVSIKRGNPLPLDSNSVFESYEALETYASGVLAYPGQIVAVVSEDSTGVYYLDQELNIQPVGVVPSGDSKTIEIADNVIQLFNFGKVFYKYNSASGEYTKTTVSTQDPWQEGLEPKLVEEDGEIVLGWFEPKPDLSSDVSTLKTDISIIKSAIGEKATDDTEATGIYADLETKANAADVYTKTETDSAISSAVANVAHLKRVIVQSVDDIDPDAANADQYIYMVPKADATSTDRYDEYMVIVTEDNNKYVEKVGDWSIDLSDYWKESEAKEFLEDYYTESEVDALLADYAKSSVLEGYVQTSTLETLLNSSYVAKENGKSLVSDTEIDKLATVSANAEPNYIKSVEDTQMTVSDEGKLTISAIDQSKVTGLAAALENKVSKKTSTVEGNEIEWTLLSPENAAKLAKLVISDDTGDLEVSGSVNADNVEGLGSWITDNRDIVSGLFSSTDEEKLDGLFDQVNENEFEVTTLDNGKTQLNIKAIDQSKITNLEETLNAKASAATVETLSSSLTGLDTRVTNLESFANNCTYADDKETIFNSITWHELGEE